MSLTAKLSDGSVKMAKDVVKENGPFYCSFCNEEMILRKGAVKIPHFAHKQGSTCAYSTGETLEHEWAKLDLFEAAERRGIKVFLEKKLSDHVRADVLLDFGDQKVAVEFQKSGMSVEQCKQRLQKYEETGIPVIWIFLLKDVQNFEGNYIYRRSIDTKIDYFSSYIYSDGYLDLTNDKEVIYVENRIYTYVGDGYIDVWRLLDIEDSKMFKVWEKIGKISLFDKDKFDQYGKNGVHLKVRDRFLLGPNILELETVLLHNEDGRILRIHYESRNKNSLREGCWEAFKEWGLKDISLLSKFDKWEDIVKKVNLNLFNFEIGVISFNSFSPFLKPVYVPDTDFINYKAHYDLIEHN
jgi:hypothetical protein